MTLKTTFIKALSGTGLIVLFIALARALPDASDSLPAEDVNITKFNKDLEFLEVRCGDETLNCKCSETGYETSKVLTEGKHSLKFKSGSKILNNFYYVASQKND